MLWNSKEIACIVEEYSLVKDPLLQPKENSDSSLESKRHHSERFLSSKSNSQPSSSEGIDQGSHLKSPSQPKKYKRKRKKSSEKKPETLSISATDYLKLEAQSSGQLDDVTVLTQLKRGRKSKKAESKRRKPQIPEPDRDTTDTDLSDDDVIKGVISSVVSRSEQGPVKRAPSRKAKKAAAATFSATQLQHNDSDDDVIDSEDDNYDVEKEYDDIMKTSRSTKRIRKRKKACFSLDESVGVDEKSTPSSSNQSSLGAQDSPKAVDQSESNNETRDQAHDKLVSSDNSGAVSPTRSADGKRPPKQQNLFCVPADADSMKIEIQPDDMIALKPSGKWLERPLVAKVISVSKCFVDVVWFTGEYTTKWMEWKISPGKNLQSNHEKVSRERVLVGGFQLTSSKKLPAKIVKRLRRLYDIIDNDA